MRRFRLTTTSIRTRLLVVYVGIILVGLSVLTILAGGQITAAVRADYEQRLQYEIRLIGQGLTQSIASYSNGDISESDLTAAFKDYETQSGGNLTLYSISDPRGEGGSEGGGGGGGRPSFYNMPELENALHGETALVERKNQAGEDTYYTAVPIVYDNHLKGLLQLSVPVQNVQGLVLQRWAILGLGFAFVTSLALLAALWLSHSIIQPLYALRESALRLSEGEFSHRVTDTRKDEIGEVAQAFNIMAHQVQSMLEEQRAFASNTSHELRTPLTAIRLRTEALRNDPTLDETTTRRYVEEIDDEVASLGNLIQDLTLLSRFDAGRAELGKDEIDFVRLASTLCHQFSAQAEEKHLRLSVALPDEPVLVNASLSHLAVVFRNLLDNSIKYTPEGGSVTWRMIVATNGVFHTIQDSGSGIAPQHLPHIFERFFRADKARSRDIPGTGLGLALVKSVVEAYGGRITIESEGVGKGTTATVFWPFPNLLETNSST